VATRAARIPIRKTGEWWSLAQDERRAIFEERSKHVASMGAMLRATVHLPGEKNAQMAKNRTMRAA
jgi:hypothetical protein